MRKIKPVKTREQRLYEWDKWMDIYNGEVHDYWIPESNKKEKKEYIVVNYAQKVPQHIARILTNKKPKITVQDPDIQKFIDKVVFNNHLIENLPGAIIATMVLGDYLVRTTYRRINENSPKPQVCIDFVHPEWYVPKMDSWDKSKVKTNELIFENEEEGVQYKRIEKDSYNLFSEEFYVKTDKDADFVLVNGQKIEHDGGLLIQHLAIDALPNEFWGRSIYKTTESLFRSLNEFITQVADVIRKHGKPKMAVPPSTFRELVKRSPVYEDAQGNRYVMVKNREVYCVEEGEKNPEYIVWDAKLDSTFELIKLLQIAISVINDIPADVLRNTDTSIPASGVAMDIMHLTSKYRAAEIAKIFKKSLETALYQAQLLEIDKGTELTGKKAEWVNVEFELDIPVNNDEHVKNEIYKYEKGVQSRKRTVIRVNDLNANELEEELELIKQDKAAPKPSETSHNQLEQTG
ncbi:hypothetical protein ACHHV8_11155 [Paenibacillus sp. TAB 01]|uniref:hypothetical protein n=1 Tax=Paenibacillus sp. TAB 01 TaxID=3368988 RepID=UPI0037527154